MSAPPRSRRRLRAALPWLLAIAILALVFRGVDRHALALALGHVSAVRFTLLVVGTNGAALAFDALATWAAFALLRTPVPLGDVLSFRGATYLLSLLSYGVGQGGMVYFLGKSRRTTAARAGGVVLYTMGSTLVALAALATFGVLSGNDPVRRFYRKILIAGAIGLVAYGAIIAARPRSLTRRPILAPLFDGGVGRQALGILLRVPHLALLLTGNFLALRLFGVHVPAGAALAYLPIVFLTTAIPITPQGLGTTQVAAQRFFTSFGPGGAGSANALAAVTAYSLCFQVGGMAAQALFGLFFLRRTAHRLAEATPVDSGPVAGPAALHL